MRKVMVLKYAEDGEGNCLLKNGKLYLLDAYESTFHQFGVDYDELETGPGQYSTAIVEHADGTVVSLPLSQIRFLDGGKEL